MIILLFFSFLAGLVTVLSPCILPILPLLLGSGIGQGPYKPLGVIIGLILSFSFFTLTLTALVELFGISPDLLRYLAIFIMIFFGVTLLFPKLEQLLVKYFSKIGQMGSLLQQKSAFAGTGLLSGLILGVALGLIWTPCAGPILAAISTLAATRAVRFSTVLITLFYSIGAALPMFLIAYGGSKIIKSTSFLSKYAESIRRFFGFLMIIAALAIAFHGDIILQQITLKYFPSVIIEDNALVRKELEKITIQDEKRGKGEDVNEKVPEFIGISGWINSIPLSINALRGKVVLVDFWTYSCINCIRTLPFLKKWYAAYKDKNFVIVGMHTPEFAFEKIPKNVEDAVKRFGIEYPVGLDGDYKTWQAYHNHYWPAHYLIDQQGIIRERYFGEGHYEETENRIRELLGLGKKYGQKPSEQVKKGETHEIYLGFARGNNYQPGQVIKKNQFADYSYQHALEADHIGLNGLWYVAQEYIRSESEMSRIDLNFMANRVYMVMQSDSAAVIQVKLDNQDVPEKYRSVDMNEKGEILVHEPRMYDILNLQGYNGRHTLSIILPKGVSLYTFTFG